MTMDSATAEHSDFSSDDGPTPLATSPHPTDMRSSSSSASKRNRPDRPKSRHPRSTSPTKPHLPHSSDSLLHHLHTDPTSSHISLSNPSAVVGPVLPVSSSGAAVDGEDVSSATPGGQVGLEASRTTSDLTREEGSQQGKAMELTASQETEVVPKGLMGKPLQVFPPSPGPPNGEKSDDAKNFRACSSSGKRRHRPQTAPVTDEATEWMLPSEDRSRLGNVPIPASNNHIPMTTSTARLSRPIIPHNPSSPANKRFATSGSPRNTHHVRLTSQPSTPQLKDSPTSDETSSATDSHLGEEMERREYVISSDEDDEQRGHDNLQQWPAISLDGSQVHSPFPQHTDDTPDEYPFHTLDKTTLAAGSSNFDVDPSINDDVSGEIHPLPPHRHRSRLSMDDLMDTSRMTSTSSGTPVESNSTFQDSPGAADHHHEPQDGCGIGEFMLSTDVTDAAWRGGSPGSAGSRSSGKRSHRTVIGSCGTVDGDDPMEDFSPTLGMEASNQSHPPQLSDWNTFIRLYSSGAWDPNKAPYPPEVIQDVSLPGLATFGLAIRASTLPNDNVQPSIALGYPSGAVGDFGMVNKPLYQLAGSGSSAGSKSTLDSITTGTSADSRPTAATSVSSKLTAQQQAASMPILSTRGDETKPFGLVEKVASFLQQRPLAASASVPEQAISLMHSPSSLVKGDTKTKSAEAAHLTLAAASLFPGDLSPFSIPSPDKELTDPMANAASSSQNLKMKKTASTSSEHGTSSSGMRSKPGGLSGSWSAPVDTESWGGLMQGALAPIAGSPVGSPAEAPGTSKPTADHVFASHPPVASMGMHRLPPMSAPAEWFSDSPEAAKQDDYFGAVVAEDAPRRSSQLSQTDSEASYAATITPSRIANGVSSGASSNTTESSPEVVSDTAAHKPRLTSRNSSDIGDVSRAKVAKRRGLFESHEAPAALGHIKSSDIPTPPMPAPYATDEAAYRDCGYLPAPLPPNEAARRKALYRYDLMNTTHDINFDRIAHLAKLVFGTKMVMITLIDDVKQFHKVAGGIGADSANRLDSICAHTILSKNDEPMVVLDTHLDWRFARNPKIVGPPFIRFYAGAPLRTHDGYNLGSLCLIDPSPRKEFPPRSRMALKEFAAIVIREMELWREKSRLRARDRIQTSMERFTRECLELDNSSSLASSAAARMEQVYERAARLIRKTLNVDGAFILDLSQFESVETTNTNGETILQYQAEAYEVEIAPSELPATAEDFLHAPAYDPHSGERMHPFGTIPPWTTLGASERLDPPGTRNQPISPTDHMKFSEFLQKNEDGRIFEHVVPSWIKHFIPPDIQYALLVPVFNIDHQPFALICAYTYDNKKLFLEGHELQFLRAIGVVLLSAVLKRRMVLADKAKSNFISNISHELRTPLHGILAAAELLSDTPLDSNQQAFLRTVQGCGNSLIETVNHVLDFTKLSGTTKGNMEAAIRPGSVSLAQLIEETVEGCWIGQRAKTFQGQSEIGSFYSPPEPPTIIGSREERLHLAEEMAHVETVIDIGMREKGWQVRCEKGGIRRVLMNLLGNSLKFTKDGYIQITLRELPHSPGDKTIPIEMAVIDTGKGISRNFLKEQLFHPFSQENPLQTGTGLGLAIVNSIVRSDSVNGKVDVWSAEGLGTEIKVSLNVDLEGASSGSSDDGSGSTSSRSSTFGYGRTISMHSFSETHRGAKLNREVMASYIRWYNFDILDDRDQDDYGDILVIDEDVGIISQLLKVNDVQRPILILAANRISQPGNALKAYEKAGGFAQMVYKPVGPGRLETSLRACAAWLDRSTPSSAKLSRSDYFSPRMVPLHPVTSPSVSDGNWPPHRDVVRRISGLSQGSLSSSETGQTRAGKGTPGLAELGSPGFSDISDDIPLYSRMPSERYMESIPGLLFRRRSEDDKTAHLAASRPSIGPRSTTDYRSISNGITLSRGLEDVQSNHHRTSSTSVDFMESSAPSTPGSPTSTVSTVSLDNGGVMLKVATVPLEAPRRARAPRVMIVDDNAVNSNLLSAYCKKKGCEFATAENGERAVQVFQTQRPGYWDLILMDISMPVMDGFEATRAIRKIESERRHADRAAVHTSSHQVIQSRAKVMALTGLGSSEDKKKAFSVGVDGYLVKPVSFRSIDLILKNLGF